MLRQAQYLDSRWREELRGGNAPLWFAGGVLLLTRFGVRSGHCRRGLRIVLLALPLPRRRPTRRRPSQTTTGLATILLS